MSALHGSVIPTRTAWISDSVFTFLRDEADRTAPKETGGVLLGYWTARPAEPVITHAVGPGARALHNRYRFIPDHDFQAAEIARLYRESNRMLQYLGDWHSHPGSSGQMSSKDRATLREIADARDARSPRPLMFILAYGPIWQPVAWVVSDARRRGIFRSRRLEQLAVRVFDAQENV